MMSEVIRPKPGCEYLFYRTLAKIAYRRLEQERREKQLKEADKSEEIKAG
ncbi:MAG: hypothetical protein P4N41_17955 [Negativicutes bacterium]|nr:hypothetical protein [Negativicutes bacterium]